MRIEKAKVHAVASLIDEGYRQWRVSTSDMMEHIRPTKADALDQGALLSNVSVEPARPHNRPKQI